MQVVLDTNVLVSAIWRPAGTCGQVVDALQNDIFVAVLDSRLLAEYVRVLTKPKLNLAAEDVADMLDYMGAKANWVVVPATFAIAGRESAPHLDDVAIAELAAFASAAAVVTGNARHFSWAQAAGVAVWSPAEFLVRLQAGGPGQ